ncbi:MAG: dUTP diphosphatase [Candidatus Hodarchaeota archaeon]
MEVKIKKLHQEAQLPKKHNTNDAAFDLYSIEEAVFAPKQTKIIHTGISMEIPIQYYGKIETRSSMASNGMFVTGGVIDSGYRGEIMVILNNFSPQEYKIKQGDRVAQIVFHQVEPLKVVDVEMLDEKNDRGGGLGSSGH